MFTSFNHRNADQSFAETSSSFAQKENRLWVQAVFDWSLCVALD
jgi:hypothetical protein